MNFIKVSSVDRLLRFASFRDKVLEVVRDAFNKLERMSLGIEYEGEEKQIKDMISNWEDGKILENFQDIHLDGAQIHMSVEVVGIDSERQPVLDIGVWGPEGCDEELLYRLNYIIKG